jgi:hypothetical protein
MGRASGRKKQRARLTIVEPQGPAPEEALPALLYIMRRTVGAGQETVALSDEEIAHGATAPPNDDGGEDTAAVMDAIGQRVAAGMISPQGGEGMVRLYLARLRWERDAVAAQCAALHAELDALMGRKN